MSSLASILTLRPELADLANLGSQLALHILKLGLQTGHYIHTSLAEPSAQAPVSTSKWKWNGPNMSDLQSWLPLHWGLTMWSKKLSQFSAQPLQSESNQTSGFQLGGPQISSCPRISLNYQKHRLLVRVRDWMDPDFLGWKFGFEFRENLDVVSAC